MENTKIWVITKTTTYLSSFHSSQSKEIVGFCLNSLDAEYAVHKFEKEDSRCGVSYNFSEASALEIVNDKKKDKQFQSFIKEKLDSMNSDIKIRFEQKKALVEEMEKIQASIDYFNSLI